jgi:hypothetical protein
MELILPLPHKYRAKSAKVVMWYVNKVHETLRKTSIGTNLKWRYMLQRSKPEHHPLQKEKFDSW